MLRDIWTKSLWDQRRALLGWSIGFIAVALIYGSFYPLAATPDYADLMESMPEGLIEAMGWGNIATPAGYLGSTVFGILGPVLVIIFAIATGARAIAGDEENGSLELVLTHPVTRTRIVFQRAVALFVGLAVMATLVFLSMLALRGPVDLDIPLSHLAAVSLELGLLGAVFGTLAMLAGGFSGRRGLVLGIAAVAAVLAYLANGVAPQVDAIAWMQEGSPFHWFDGTATLESGFDTAGTLLLAGTSLVFVAGAAWSFSRRDVGT